MSDQYAHVSWKGYTSPDDVEEMIVCYYTIEREHSPKCIHGTPVLFMRGCYKTRSDWMSGDTSGCEFNGLYGWVITLLVPL